MSEGSGILFRAKAEELTRGEKAASLGLESS